MDDHYFAKHKKSLATWITQYHHLSAQRFVRRRFEETFLPLWWISLGMSLAFLFLGVPSLVAAVILLYMYGRRKITQCFPQDPKKIKQLSWVEEKVARDIAFVERLSYEQLNKLKIFRNVSEVSVNDSNRATILKTINEELGLLLDTAPFCEWEFLKEYEPETITALHEHNMAQA